MYHIMMNRLGMFLVGLFSGLVIGIVFTLFYCIAQGGYR